MCQSEIDVRNEKSFDDEIPDRLILFPTFSNTIPILNFQSGIIFWKTQSLMPLRMRQIAQVA